MGNSKTRKPPWLKVKLPTGRNFFELRERMKRLELNTVCAESLCPNVAECWGRGTATIMILGDVCTRACGFCAVTSGRPKGLDEEEPERVAKAVAEAGWKYLVMTSVARDDLADGGSKIFAECITLIKAYAPAARVEVLIPDFQGSIESLRRVVEAGPDVLAHNIECVRRLQKTVRSRSSWECSMGVLKNARKLNPKQMTKTGLQLGHGETRDEILEVIDAMAGIGVAVMTIGQYLQPTKVHRSIDRYYTPEEFAAIGEEAKRRGIRYVFSGPLVRSSYKAEQVFAG